MLPAVRFNADGEYRKPADLTSHERACRLDYGDRLHFPTYCMTLGARAIGDSDSGCSVLLCVRSTVWASHGRQAGSRIVRYPDDRHLTAYAQARWQGLALRSMVVVPKALQPESGITTQLVLGNISLETEGLELDPELNFDQELYDV